MKKLVTGLMALVTSLSLCAAEQELTYLDLVKRLTDLERLATLPAPGEQCAQCSSYDRASRYDAASGKYINWDANADGDGIIRKEGDKLVLAEMEGPGCIWRIWSAAPKDGHVRIYLDGASEPAVDLPFAGYFNGKNAPFTRSALVHTVGTGWNNYTPIPYQKSCKVVADPGWGLYYHFTYGTFPKGTHVPTFKRDLSKAESSALDQANDLLLHCGAFTGPFSFQGMESMSREASHQSLAAGDKMEFTYPEPAGDLILPAAITSINVHFSGLPPSPADREALRAITLEMRWDGETEPSVWSPIGDFFGTAPGMNTYRSYPVGVTDDGWFYCHWFMPFATNAQIRIRNESQFDVGIKFLAATRPLFADAGGYARFHAKWHRDAFLPREPERWIDWPMLKTEGAGRFVGVMLHVWNPRGGWWGEGDEKFFVNGEKFPSTFGTGSEDYFGYAWCNPTLFQHAYHNQTHNDGNNRGHVSVNRWQISDNVPFQTSFEGCIEKYYPNQRPTLYAVMAYWYLAPGGNDPYRPLPLTERVGYWTEVQTFKVKGAIEGEKLKILGQTGGHTQEQDMTGFAGQWSNDAHLWWTEAKPGDKLDLALPVKQAGKYRLGLQLTKAPDYGIVQLYLDGQKLGDPIDLYHESVMPTGLLALGAHDLTVGEHKLTVEIVGANDKAIKSYMFGLDYVNLDPL
ncbi:MAG: glycoside hydrolase family 172 protein [Verrucomicrobiota bacterium]|jgi:hypothetical protein